MSEDNLLIRISSYDTGTMLPPVHVSHYDFYITYAQLEQMREEAATGSESAHRFLELLGAVDFAGSQRKPVLLMGRKDAGVASGFHLSVSIPVSGAPVRNPFADTAPTQGGE